MSKFLIAPAALALAVILAACGGSPPADNAAAPAEPADTMAPVDNTMAPAEPAAEPAADPAAPATGG